jgi:outer membrane lipoprotein-sorting protein
MRRSPRVFIIPLFLTTLFATGCLFRTRPVEEQYSKAPLKEASQQQLIDSINQQAQAIQSLKATVDIDTSAGGMKKGQVTDYKEIRGYVLLRKPDALHMIGLMPIVRTTAFDMVSDGQNFKLWIPPKNRFVIGNSQTQAIKSDQPMENLRPGNIYEALVIPSIDPDAEIAVPENSYEILHDAKGHRVLQEDYELIIVRRVGNGGKLARKIVFSRTDLKPHRQYVYDDDGKVATDVRYAEYKDFDGVSFASRIEIGRPQEEYDITLNMLKVEINTPLTNQQFTLDQPDGAEVVHLDQPQSTLVVPVGQNQ